MKTLRQHLTGVVLGIALVIAGTAVAATTARYRGTHTFDKIRVTELEQTNMDAGASDGTEGSVDIFPTTASKGKISITATDNTNNDTLTITNAAQGGAYTYTIPNAGESASFVMTEGAQTVNDVKTFGSVPVLPAGGLTAGSTTITETELGYLDGLTLGTVAASKAVTVDANSGTSGLELVKAGQYRKDNGTTFTAADPNPSRATLRGSGFWLVDTTANAVDLDFSDDADLEAADIGTDWVFMISAGGTNALTITNGASGVAITTLNTLGTTCEDVGDQIRCTGLALEAAVCVTTCAD